MKNAFYFKKINIVGGCESFYWYLSKKYDFTIYYKEADPEQIKRLSQNVECRKYKERINCDQFFCNYAYDIDVNSPVKKHIIHCDYKNVSFKPLIYKDFEYIGVSKLVCDSFKELTGKDAEMIYNPIYIEKTKVEKYNDDKLHLISATRLTREKGLYRMKALAKLLEANNIDYVWEVYTNKTRIDLGKNVVYKKPKLDILEEIAKADYLVQLSDCEAYCYSIVESLMLGTPVICTDLPVLKELEIEHKKNAVICDFNMSNVDVDLIKSKSLKVNYKAPTSNWNKYLSTEKTYNCNDLVEVKVLRDYTDIEMNKKLIKNDIVKMTKARASYLEAKGLIEWL